MLPSIKTLSAVFGADAKRAREILEMRRAQLETLPTCQDRIRECYHSPDTYDLRMTALDQLANTDGIETIETPQGLCHYLNAGDTYSATLILYQKRYRVGCWGDIAEKHC
jgi:hypothetical protein